MASIGVVIILVAFVGIGFAIGRYTIIKTFDVQIRSVSGAYTLEGVLNDKKKLEIAREEIDRGIRERKKFNFYIKDNEKVEVVSFLPIKKWLMPSSSCKCFFLP